MAAITITTPTFLDDGTARAAGDTYNINGTTFTVRTDSRVYANAPASMTGSLNNMIVSNALGGTFIVDGSKVRWLAYNSGTGNVPAIGTTITQGGVSGYLLGVWPDYVSAPTTPGSAVPTTGYLKFRETTGGTYSAGALTGIGASATGPDVTGWIEIAMDTNTSFQGYELGGGIIFNGGWFYLDNTTGTRGQQISVPTNGGGTGTHVFAVQIETAAGSGVFEWYPTASKTLGAVNWNTTNLATDIRSKFVETMGNGVIRIGSDGTTNIAYLPPSGCKVRIPNIFGRTVSTASRNVNQVPGAVTRAGMINGNYSLNGYHGDFTINALTANHFTMVNSVYEPPALSIANNRDPVIFDNVCVGSFMATASACIQLAGINNSSFSNSKLTTQIYGIGALYCSGPVANCTFTNLEIIAAKARTAASLAIYSGGGLSNITFNGLKLKNGSINIGGGSNITFKNVDYIDRIEGNTTTANPAIIFNINATTNITVDGLTFGENGLIDNVQPYSPLWQAGATPNSNVKVRNFGTRLAPLSSGTNPLLYPTTIFSVGTVDFNNSFQRLFVTGARTAVFGPLNYGNYGILVEDVQALNFAIGQPEKSTAGIFRKIGGTLPSIYSLPSPNSGTHWADYFTSTTQGAIKWIGESPTTDTAPLNYLDVTPSQGTGYINSTTSISLDTINDAIYSEMSWTVLGHTGFQNATPVLAGAPNGLVCSYQLDTGTGYSGTWKAATGANLSAESISPTGFKMKIRIQQTGASNQTNYVSLVTFLTTTSVAAQAANLYPLDTVRLSFEGLQPGSEVRAYVGTDPTTSVEIGGVESVVGTTFSFTHSSAGLDGYVMIFALGFQPIRIPRTYQNSDSTLLIQQVIDRNYLNP